MSLPGRQSSSKCWIVLTRTSSYKLPRQVLTTAQARQWQHAVFASCMQAFMMFIRLLVTANQWPTKAQAFVNMSMQVTEEGKPACRTMGFCGFIPGTQQALLQTHAKYAIRCKVPHINSLNATALQARLLSSCVHDTEACC